MCCPGYAMANAARAAALRARDFATTEIALRGANASRSRDVYASTCDDAVVISATLACRSRVATTLLARFRVTDMISWPADGEKGSRHRLKAGRRGPWKVVDTQMRIVIICVATTKRESVMFESHAVALGVSDSGVRTHSVAEPRVRAFAPQRIASDQLLGGRNELVIEHAGQEYRLRLTRNDKLILTK